MKMLMKVLAEDGMPCLNAFSIKLMNKSGAICGSFSAVSVLGSGKSTVSVTLGPVRRLMRRMYRSKNRISSDSGTVLRSLSFNT